MSTPSLKPSASVPLAFLLREERKTQRVSHRPPELSLADIQVYPGAFQWRRFGSDVFTEERHVKDLVRVLKATGGPLDPILVTAVGSSFYVVDGHHRLSAYQQVAWSSAIPVAYFEGSVVEARLKALELNIKDKLPMTLADKYEAAWVLAKEGKENYSKRQIKDLTTVSESTVATMRRILRDHPEAEGFPWSRAKGLQFESDGDFDANKWLDEAAEKLTQQLLKVVTVKLLRNPEVLAESLRRIDPSLPSRLVQEWSEEAYELVEGLEDEEE